MLASVSTAAHSPPEATMPKTKLQVAAAEEKRTKKAHSVLGTLAALLGLSTDDAKPAAGKMRKVTETHKHVKIEEEEGADSEAEEEEEGSTGSTGDDGDSTGSTHSESEEEEEEESAASEEEEEEEKESAAKPEEEEEKALARAVGKALNSEAVQKAFLAALPKAHRDAGALFSPHRLASMVKKTTGERSTFGAMHALSTAKKQAKAGDAKILRKQASLETRVAKVEGARTKDRVDAIVKVAKEKGVAGATTHDGRVALREYGMKHGATALTKHLAAMPVIVGKPRIPREDGAGAPSADAQLESMIQAATAGLSEKDAKFVREDIERKHNASLNGAARGTET